MALVIRRGGPGLALAGLLAAAAVPGCVYHRTCLRPESPALVPQAGDVEVTFLGVGGFLIRYRPPDRRCPGPECTETVLTAPFYSSPTFGEIATQPAWSDQRLIDALLPDVGDAKAILSGHSHYDHLMDVPYVALRHARAANIYGNDAMTRLLAPLCPRLAPRRLVSLESKARALEGCRGEARCPDAFEPIGDSIRVWPILSEHSPQFAIPGLPRTLFPPVHLWRGDLLEARKELPSRPGEWVEGTTLAYLIDFLDRPGGAVAFRVYYQDSAAREPFGFPPAGLMGRRPDLALLCVGGSENLKEQPVALLKWLRPRFVMAGHWEDFFNPRELPLPDGKLAQKNPCCERVNGLLLGKPKDFLNRVRETLRKDERFCLPCPGATSHFEPDGTGWRIRMSTEVWEAGGSARTEQ